MVRAILGTMIAATLITACRTTPEPVPLSASRADLQTLEGQWIGEYHSYDASGRSGTLLFRLETGRDTVRGDVLMHVAGRETAEMIPFTTDPWQDVADEQVLSITFVPGADGTVVGRLDVYNDPVCGCEIATTFTGRVKGNLVEGSYTSQHVNGADRNTGRWRVVRSFPDA